MAYLESNSPQLLVPSIGDRPAIWSYEDGDDDATVNGTDYFTNAEELGMKVGDVVFLHDTSAGKVSVLYVSAIDSDGNGTTAFAAVS